MAKMDWPTLTANKTVSGSIRNWVNYSKVDPEEVIAEAEDWMQMFVRTLHMEERMPMVLKKGASSFDFINELPRFLDPISVFLMGNYYLRYRSLDDFDHIRFPHEDGSMDEGAPRFFAVSGDAYGAMLFDVMADQDYNILVNFYQRPTPLGPTQNENYWTLYHRSIFKEILLSRAYQSMKDNAAENEHLQKAAGFIQQMKVNDDLKLRAQQHLVQVS